VTDWNTGVPKDDPNFVEWKAYMVTLDGKFDEDRKEIKVHICTPEDKDKFGPPNQASEEVINERFEAGHFWCFD
jgi:hypothetical protein